METNIRPGAATTSGQEHTTEETGRTRQLITAAHDLLGEEGLEGLTIRAVLKRTGLARRAFYESFAGKDDLMLAVFEDLLQAAADHYGEQARRLTDPLETIREIVTGLVIGTAGGYNDFGDYGGRRSAAMAREHLRLAESRPAELAAALSPLLNLIADQVTEGIRKGQLRECDPALQATLIYNLVATTVHTELLAHEGTEADVHRRQELAERIWEFCRRAIVA
jgi:AcrR family transcriptional regulator